jgi:hypothetical protein
MIQVAINPNVILIGAEINDKNTLALKLDETANVGKEKVDFFEASQTAAVDETGKTGISLNIFSFKKPSGPKNENKTVDELLQMINDDILKVKSQLTQLLEIYLKSADIKWEPYLGTGVDASNWREKLLVDDILGSIFTNYAKQFIAMATPFFGKAEYAMRVKLVRQSKEKHYGTIPGRFLKDNPWVELMEIPEAQSKVKFTKWEIDNGYNDGTPVPKATADAAPADIPAATEAANIFGSR